MSTDKHVPDDEDWVPTEEEVRHFSRAWLTESDFDRFLARIRRDAAREALDQAEARIKAVRDLCDDADKRHASVLIVTKVRRALDT